MEGIRMDPEHGDRLATKVRRGASRRGMLKGLLDGALVVGGLGAPTGPAVAAKKKHHHGGLGSAPSDNTHDIYSLQRTIEETLGPTERDLTKLDPYPIPDLFP